MSFSVSPNERVSIVDQNCESKDTLLKLITCHTQGEIQYLGRFALILKLSMSFISDHNCNQNAYHTTDLKDHSKVHIEAFEKFGEYFEQAVALCHSIIVNLKRVFGKSWLAS